MTTHTHTRRSRVTLASVAAVAVLVSASLLGACAGGDDEPAGSTPQTSPSSASSSDSAGTGTTPEIELTQVGELDSPTVLVARPGDDDLWVAERGGTVRRLAVDDSGALSADGPVVLDISDQTSTDSERGLLGLAFSEDGDTLFVSHTDTDGNTRVASYPIVDDRVQASDRDVLFAVDQPYPNHNGGDIVLGPDGGLWLGLGDGGARDDPENRAQTADTPLGKLIRLDPETGASKIMASGLRNPWRFAFDTDESLWIGDVGQDQVEEIDHVPFDQIEGANFGWSGFEGDQPYQDGEGRVPQNPVAPVFTYTHDDGNCSITGGFVYRGPVESLTGAYLFADYCAGRLRAITLGADGTLAREYDLGIDVAQPISFGTDAGANAYVLSAAGGIFRIDAA